MPQGLVLKKLLDFLQFDISPIQNMESLQLRTLLKCSPIPNITLVLAVVAAVAVAAAGSEPIPPGNVERFFGEEIPECHSMDIS